MEKSLLSIIIPTKNEEKFLPVLLESIRQQSISTELIPIIIADNKSTDKTIEIAKDFVKLGLDIKIIEGGPVAVARNNGAKVCNSKYIIFLDADTGIQKDFLEKVCLAIESNNKCYSPYIHDKEFKLTYEIMWFGFNFCLKTKVIGNILAGGSIIVKKESFDEVSGFNENISTHEDVELARKFSKKELECFDTTVYFNNRRFDRDGFWSVFLMYGKVFISGVIFNKYNLQSNKDYFNKTF
jgi:glycosyltransferase involved in cell wall biosynthesis